MTLEEIEQRAAAAVQESEEEETQRLPALQRRDIALEQTYHLPAPTVHKVKLEKPGWKALLDGAQSAFVPIPSLTEKVAALKVAQKAAYSGTEDVSLPLAKKVPWWLAWFKDPWLVATISIACLASIASLCYFFQTHQILLYGDAYSHLLIARRLFDNATPGLAQLGGVWLPLPHLLMVPFVFNDYLWRTGLAGSIPSMLCYLIATVYLFLAARRLTKNSAASFVGTLLFILNPNILYLQATPLSELVLIATLTMACYHFLAWAQDDNPRQLILASAATFLATLARYDGWFLFIAFLGLIVIIGWMRRHRWTQIEGTFVIFATLGGLGIALWLLWCDVIFGDPLYFQRGPFSAQAQQKDLIKVHLLFTNHNLWLSVRYYTIDAMDTLGPILFVLFAVAVLLFVLRHRISPDMLAALAFLVPLTFYISSLYGGQAALFLPYAVPANVPYQLFNARYAAVAVAPAALFISTLAARWSTLASRWSPAPLSVIGPVVLVIAILVQTALTAYGGIISLQDGQFGLACTPPHATIIYLAQHYGGGRILEDLYTSKIDELEPEVGVDFKNIVYEGSGELWQRALAHPEATVDWIIANPTDHHDLVAQGIDLHGPTFLSHFTLMVAEQGGLSLFRRTGAPSSQERPVPPDLLTGYRHCKASSVASKANAPVPSPRDGMDERDLVLWSKSESRATMRPLSAERSVVNTKGA